MMKNSFRLATILVFAASFIWMLPAQAQQAVTGTAQMGVYGANGDSTSGTNYGGSSNAAFTAKDPSNALGQATAGGGGNGSTWTGTNSVSSQAQGTSNSNTTASGNDVSQSVSGTASQGNWVGMGNGANSMNWADAGNATSGKYDGTVAGTSGFSLSGNASADGHSTVTSYTGASSASSTTKTVGESTANVTTGNIPQCFTVQIDPSVQGQGSVSAQSFVGDPNATFAGASHTGTASYGTSNESSASGWLGIQGSNSAQIGTNSVSASSTIAAQATAH